MFNNFILQITICSTQNLRRASLRQLKLNDFSWKRCKYITCPFYLLIVIFPSNGRGLPLLIPLILFLYGDVGESHHVFLSSMQCIFKLHAPSTFL